MSVADRQVQLRIPSVEMSGPTCSTSCLLSLMLCAGDAGLSVLSAVSIPSVGGPEETGKFSDHHGIWKDLMEKNRFYRVFEHFSQEKRGDVLSVLAAERWEGKEVQGGHQE